MAESNLDKTLYQDKHSSLYDYEFQKHLAKAPWSEWLSQSGYFEIKDEYIDKIHKWIHSSKLNEVKGLERFKYRDMIHGTTQAFDESYYRNANKRLRILRGEYAYHKRVVKDFQFLDDEQGNFIPIEKGDWVIVSYPFCGNGGIPPHFDQIQNQCLELDVPILLDCAWYGTCRDLIFDVSHPAITEVCFSLTKGIGLGNIRSGIRYSNHDDNLPIRQQNNYNHLPLGAGQIGLWQMQKFSPDHVQDKYFSVYRHICETMNILPTHCIHIGMLDKEHAEYDYYLTDKVYSRIGMRNAVKQFYKKNPNPVFCKAPFTSIYYRGAGDLLAFCCAQTDRIDLNVDKSTIRDWWTGDYSQNFRQKFVDGQWPDGCEVCEWQEKKGMESDRTSFQPLPIKSLDVIHGNNLKKPMYIDYRPDNLCNLMCTMCSPGNSNLIDKIYKEFPDVFGKTKNYEFNQETQDKILKDEMIDKDTVMLKVLGGEPTINKKVHTVLKHCIENDYAKNISLRITSNFTNLNSFYGYLDHFKEVKVQASCDATGPTYEYIRKPARWKKIKENLLEFAERYKTNNRFRFGMNCVFQPASAFTTKEWLPELLKLHYESMKINRPASLNVLPISDPEGLTFSSLPPKFRKKVVDDLLEVKEMFKDHPSNDLRKNIDDMLLYITDFTKYDYNMLKIFKTKTLTLDKAKKTDITTLHPLFKELLEYEE